jgi:Anticodon binding domain
MTLPTPARMSGIFAWSGLRRELGVPHIVPPRRALTGLDHGPDMAALLPLIGKERTVGRLGSGTRVTMSGGA